VVDTYLARWRHSRMTSIEHTPHPSDQNEDSLQDVFEHCWDDVADQIWLSRKDARAKVLRTFRAPDDSCYSFRLAWFSAAIHAARARKRAQLDMEIMVALSDTALAPLVQLRKLVEARNSSHPDGRELLPSNDAVPEDFDNQESALREEELDNLAKAIDHVLAHAPQIRAALSEALPRSAPLRARPRALADDMALLAYELRRQGFQVREIVALLKLGPPLSAVTKNPFKFKQRMREVREKVRQKLIRDFAKTKQRIPPPGGSVRGPVELSYAPMSIRTCSDTDDADTD
jgi:hypothetical protein